MMPRPTFAYAPGRVFVVASLLLAGGCVSSSHHLQRARALSRWQVEAVAGTALPISSQVYDAAMDALDVLEPRVTAAQSGGSALSAAEVRSLVESSLALMLFSPLPSSELSARVGVGYDIDVGLRLSGPRTQLDAKWQGLRQDQHGVDGALSWASVATASRPSRCSALSRGSSRA